MKYVVLSMTAKPRCEASSKSLPITTIISMLRPCVIGHCISLYAKCTQSNFRASWFFISSCRAFSTSRDGRMRIRKGVWIQLGNKVILQIWPPAQVGGSGYIEVMVPEIARRWPARQFAMQYCRVLWKEQDDGCVHVRLRISRFP